VHIVDLPDMRAIQHPSGTCLADDRETLDNAGFRSRVQAAASVLYARGVAEGDVVGVVLPYRVDLVVVMFAAWRLGAAITLACPALTDSEIAFRLTDSRASVVVGDVSESPSVNLDAKELIAEDFGLVVPRVRLDGLALIIYSFSAGGQRRCLRLDHTRLALLCQRAADGFGLDETSRSLLVLPAIYAILAMVKPAELTRYSVGKDKPPARSVPRCWPARWPRRARPR